MAQTCMGDIRCRAATAFGVAAAALYLLIPSAARAGFTSSGTIGSGDVGMTLRNNTVYVVPHSVTLTRTTPYTALYVEPGATAVIYIPSNVTFTVNGGNASGTEGAGAGIRVDSNSTLVVTGEGTLNVTGGNAANGADGGAWRSNGYYSPADVGSSHLDAMGGGNGGDG
ncbi:MAG: carbohydrate-binding domain-containing protein, partial [Kiritimatiellae bacterium]|nr:carbohydrate-binding domain-containing protein [Kiritimatiellia bacterium]